MPTMPYFLRWVLASQVCSVRENPSKCILTMCALFSNFIMSMTQGAQASRELWKQGVRSGLSVCTDRLESCGQREELSAGAAGCRVLPPPPHPRKVTGSDRCSPSSGVRRHVKLTDHRRALEQVPEACAFAYEAPVTRFLIFLPL